MRVSLLAATALVLCAGCASDRMPTASDVAGFQQVTADLSTSAASYRASTSSMQSPSDCISALQHYMSRAMPDVDQMRLVAGRMDDQLMAFGRTMDGDLACGMDVIDAELKRHAADACGSPDMSSNRAEATRHCDAMQSFIDHLHMRSAELTGMMGTTPGMMDGGMGRAGMDGGWSMPDGGWMGWGHEMLGCSFADGGYSTNDGGTPWADGGTWMMDGGMPSIDGGSMPGWDGGMPPDSGMPGWDAGMPGTDGGPMMDGGMH